MTGAAAMREANPDLSENPRFATLAERSHNNLDVALTALLPARDVDDWVARFRAAGVPVTSVGGLEQSVRSDITAERGTFAKLDGVPLVRLPWMVDGHAVPWSRPAPRLGEHTLEVLAEAGFDDAEVAELLRSGAALGPDRGAHEAAA